MRTGLAAWRLKAAITDDFTRDLEGGRGFLWWPVAFGLGAAGYFVPLDEPGPWVFGLVPAAGLMALAALLRRCRFPFAATLLLLASLGFLHAALMTWLSGHPTLAYERVVTVKGLVERVEDRDSFGERLTLRPVIIEPAPREGLPPRIRLTARGLEPLPEPGDGLSVRAVLGPPSAPVLPGGYDFARVAWFADVGGTGFSLGKPAAWADAPKPGRGLRLIAGVESIRQAIATRIRGAVAGDAGGIAAALIVGDRGGISRPTSEAMRISGLSHILSISGLHMSLVAASLFASLRLLMAAVPPLSLRLPAKKIAAALALVGTTTYFVFSGMDVPAERSAIMVAVMLFAVLIDRRALSMRVIAVAALTTLTLSPEAVLDPGAEMSFAAVVALIAGLEAARQGDEAPADISLLARFVRRAATLLLAAMATTLVAGAATTPIALYHFGRLAPLGLLANLMAAPLTSFIVMPAAMVAMLAMPFGLDGWPLAVMGLGIEGIIAVARLVAAWTPGGGLWGRPDAFAILLLVAGGLWICLWTGRKRWFGVLGLTLGAVGVWLSEPPAMIVDGDGRAVITLEGAGTPHLVGRPGRFALDVWLAALGLEAEKRDLTAGSACDDEACVGEGVGGKVAVIAGPLAFGEECDGAAVVVSALAAPPWCRAGLTLDGPALTASGARLYVRSPSGALVETERVYGTARRPWQVPFDAGRW